jgi:hypothetical protein
MANILNYLLLNTSVIEEISKKRDKDLKRTEQNNNYIKENNIIVDEKFLYEKGFTKVVDRKKEPIKNKKLFRESYSIENIKEIAVKFGMILAPVDRYEGHLPADLAEKIKNF